MIASSASAPFFFDQAALQPAAATISVKPTKPIVPVSTAAREKQLWGAIPFGSNRQP